MRNTKSRTSSKTVIGHPAGSPRSLRHQRQTRNGRRQADDAAGADFVRPRARNNPDQASSAGRRFCAGRAGQENHPARGHISSFARKPVPYRALFDPWLSHISSSEHAAYGTTNCRAAAQPGPCSFRIRKAPDVWRLLGSCRRSACLRPRVQSEVRSAQWRRKQRGRAHALLQRLVVRAPSPACPHRKPVHRTNWRKARSQRSIRLGTCTRYWVGARRLQPGHVPLWQIQRGGPAFKP